MSSLFSGASTPAGQAGNNPWAQEVFPYLGEAIGAIFGGIGAPVGYAAGSALGNVVATGDVAGAPAGSEASNATNLGGVFQGQGIEGLFNFLGGSMGDANPLSGLLGGGSSSSSTTTTGTPLEMLYNQDELASIMGGMQNIAGEETGYAQPLLGSGLGQYFSGLSGQLTPAQQALTNETLSQMNLGTAGSFANLGLGGSTMESQDIGANRLATLAQTNQMMTGDELLGMQAMQEGLGFLNQGAGTLGQSANVENLLNTQQYQQQLLADQQNQANSAGLTSALANAAGAFGSKSGSGAGAGSSSIGSTAGSLINDYGTTDDGSLVSALANL